LKKSGTLFQRAGFFIVQFLAMGLRAGSLKRSGRANTLIQVIRLIWFGKKAGRGWHHHSRAPHRRSMGQGG
jgi:hypothetical protein